MPHWANAVEQARAAAATVLCGDDEPAYPPTPYYWTEQFGISMRLAGLLPPIGDVRTVDGDFAGASALITWTDEHGATTTAAAINHRTCGTPQANADSGAERVVRVAPLTPADDPQPTHLSLSE